MQLLQEGNDLHKEHNVNGVECKSAPQQEVLVISVRATEMIKTALLDGALNAMVITRSSVYS